VIEDDCCWGVTTAERNFPSAWRTPWGRSQRRQTHRIPSMPRARASLGSGAKTGQSEAQIA